MGENNKGLPIRSAWKELLETVARHEAEINQLKEIKKGE